MLCCTGLPVPIVAITAGIANEHYGSEDGLVYWYNDVWLNTYT